MTDQLCLLLEGSDFVPRDLMEMLKMALPGQNTQRLLQQIEKHIGNIEYRQALNTLAELETFITPHLE